jgi:hypothetical protein
MNWRGRIKSFLHRFTPLQVIRLGAVEQQGPNIFRKQTRIIPSDSSSKGVVSSVNCPDLLAELKFCLESIHHTDFPDFTLSVRSNSQIGPHAGRGVFLKGKVASIGRIVALYPGLVYEKHGTLSFPISSILLIFSYLCFSRANVFFLDIKSLCVAML